MLVVAAGSAGPISVRGTTARYGDADSAGNRTEGPVEIEHVRNS